MPCLKKDAPPDLVEAVRQIEERADGCFGSLTLLRLPSNAALWSMLAGGIKLIEEEIASRGDNTSHLDATLLNISRFIPIAMKWAVQHGKPASKLANRRWTANIAARVDELLSVAHQYSGFLTCLPMWHKDRYAVDLISPTLARFTAPGSARHRQVSAHQKGFRPKIGDYKGQRAKKPEQTPQVQELFAQVFEGCRRTGTLRFEYDDPWELWLELLPEYQARMTAIVRRADSLSLGDYTLGDFERFYAALLAVCAVHEFLCFTWKQIYGLYPFDSAVLIRSRPRWADILSRLSGVSQKECQTIVGDLTFDFSRSLDLHVHPFVPLDTSILKLAVAPQFPLHSRLDENILRVCSMLRPTVFDATSLEKESETLIALQATHSLHSLQGPIALPKPNPDIDLIVADESSSTIVIAELKWIRKTTRPIELIDRDADVLKGIKQLRQVRDFLLETPSYLSSQGKLPRPVSEYRNVYFTLVARDHWLWIDPEDDIAIVEFEAFSSALTRSESLHSAMSDLLKYVWLPVEGRDFTVRYDRSIANGVAIESEVFYPT
jgi:hypothetical protein